jgi:hypothetical protein
MIPDLLNYTGVWSNIMHNCYEAEQIGDLATADRNRQPVLRADESILIQNAMTNTFTP